MPLIFYYPVFDFWPIHELAAGIIHNLYPYLYEPEQACQARP